MATGEDRAASRALAKARLLLDEGKHRKAVKLLWRSVGWHCSTGQITEAVELAESIGASSSGATLKEAQKVAHAGKETLASRQARKSAISRTSPPAPIAELVLAFLKIAAPTREPSVLQSIPGIGDYESMMVWLTKRHRFGQVREWSSVLGRAYAAGYALIGNLQVVGATEPAPLDRTINDLMLNRVSSGLSLELAESRENRPVLLAWGMMDERDECVPLMTWLDVHVEGYEGMDDHPAEAREEYLATLRALRIRHADDQKFFALCWTLALQVGFAQAVIDLASSANASIASHLGDASVLIRGSEERAARTPTSVPASPTEFAPLSASDQYDLKLCPDCAEEVRSAAKLCRFCGYDFTTGARGSKWND